MEHLFSTNIAMDKQDVRYHVVFDHEKYVFTPELNNQKLPSFSFKREHDEWHEQQALPPEIRQQAVDALENYLLKQH